MPMRSDLRSLSVLACFLALSACTGVIDGDAGDVDNPFVPGPNDAGTGGTSSAPDPGVGLGSTPDEVEQACRAAQGKLDVGITKLRRLTRAQLDNTLAALLGVGENPAQNVAPDERMGPFHSNAIAPITELLVQQYQELAARVAQDAVARMSEIAPCDLNTAGDGCVARFVRELGGRAYRRPLAEDEVQKLSSLYQLAAQNGGAQKGFRRVVEAVLQSPFFLYHVDAAATGLVSATPQPIDAHSLASRLSYFLWNSMPDERLFDLAASQALLDEAVLGAEVERMLDDPKAKETIGLFHRQWLGVADLLDAHKDPALFPAYGPALAAAMLEETADFSAYVIREGDGLLRTLLTADFAFPRGPLFALYGVTEPAGFVPGTPVALDPTQRAGLLTQAAFLARHAHANQTSPVHRGILVRENFMCQPLEPPPANVNASPPPPTPTSSTRERFTQHQADPLCRGCHGLIDGIGLGFEHYDAIGAWRTHDGLGPVDARGEIVEADADLAGPFDGAVELAHKLADSQEVAGCVGRQWFRFALGRVESVSDACSVKRLQDALTESGGNLRSMLTRIALSDAFRYVRVTAQEEM